ncbi:nucleotide disphospho-sugar-binding domain-containing protein [Actinoplanes sp. TFC3]|uniref:nucleotide disphospho-sugar-binding domain-containing protein n=1 Tax=Actinoplanes sp. TFC3 TaxID=1710355 RepID=UPI00082EE4CD|nr:nucleotide disphospho-sugar-binding domain-containing protein [Actinoplanes sp. TFC3]
MAKIIVAAPPVPGEFGPMLNVARALAGRGHQITVLSGSLFRAATEQAGLAFVALEGDADYDIREHVAEREALNLPPGPAQLNHDWIHAFANPMPEEHKALQALLAQDPEQYLVCNVLFLGAMPVKYGVPGLRPAGWVAVSVVGLAISSDDSTFFGPVPAAGPEEARAANRAGNAQFAAALEPARNRVAELLRYMGATEPFTSSFVDGTYLGPDATAVLTVPGFEFERSDLPGTIHLVGALPPQPAGNWEPPAWWSELDGSRPVVVVTQGTLANHDLSQLVEPALAGLADQDVTVVAALGGADPASLSIPVPDNARVASYIPFEALLPRASVLITNGGAGGTHQALAAGVPVIIAGETEDKPANAARVAYHRLGIDLRTGNPSPQAVAEATAAVLTDEVIHENVARLAKVYAEHDPVAEIERLALS